MNNLHYPSLDRCKKLTELGFPKTELSFCDFRMQKRDAPNIQLTNVSHNTPRYQNEFISHCPSVMELMDVIPEEIEDWSFAMNWGEWGYQNEYDSFEVGFSGTSPNALSDLIVWLVENGRLTFDKR